MVRSRFLIKSVLFTTLVVIFFVVVGAVGSFWLNSSEWKKEKKMGRRMGPPGFIVEKISEVPPEDRPFVIERLVQRPGPFGKKVKIYLLDKDGKVLFPEGSEVQEIDTDTAKKSWLPPPFRFLISGKRKFHVLELQGVPKQYMAFGKRTSGRFESHFRTTLLIVLVSIFFGVLFSLGVMFFLLRKKARQMEAVIVALKKGNLQARMPIEAPDEMTKVAVRFNEMASEIESLVTYLRDSERMRKNFFRELAHDLRTPIASMKNLLETVRSSSEKVSSENRLRCADLAAREVEYFEALVENLLFLGQVSEPRYKQEGEWISVSNLISNEISAIEERYPQIEADIETAEETAEFFGDRRLFERMIRNILENAFSFASSKVSVSWREKNGELSITVKDDGPGFKDEDLEKYGVRKSSRKVAETHNGRISIGLGSVIVRSIAELYRGCVEVKNVFAKDGRKVGASVEIHLFSLQGKS